MYLRLSVIRERRNSSTDGKPFSQAAVSNSATQVTHSLGHTLNRCLAGWAEKRDQKKVHACNSVLWGRGVSSETFKQHPSKLHWPPSRKAHHKINITTISHECDPKSVTSLAAESAFFRIRLVHTVYTPSKHDKWAGKRTEIGGSGADPLQTHVWATVGCEKLMPVSVRKSALRRSGACILPTVFGLRRVHVSLTQAGPLLKSRRRLKQEGHKRCLSRVDVWCKKGLCTT